MAEPYVGEIRQFAGTFAPQGWALCNGQLLSIDDNDVLFNLIGTTYGGDGQTTFGVPDLQGRVPLHQGNGYVVGQKDGSETVTLNANQLPSHTHVPGASNAGGSENPAGNLWAKSSANSYAPQPSNATMNPGSVGSMGASQPHENRIPFVAVTYIISLFGIYPTPS